MSVTEVTTSTSFAAPPTPAPVHSPGAILMAVLGTPPTALALIAENAWHRERRWHWLPLAPAVAAFNGVVLFTGGLSSFAMVFLVELALVGLWAQRDIRRHWWTPASSFRCDAAGRAVFYAVALAAVGALAHVAQHELIVQRVRSGSLTILQRGVWLPSETVELVAEATRAAAGGADDVVATVEVSVAWGAVVVHVPEPYVRSFSQSGAYIAWHLGRPVTVRPVGADGELAPGTTHEWLRRGRRVPPEFVRPLRAPNVPLE